MISTLLELSYNTVEDLSSSVERFSIGNMTIAQMLAARLEKSGETQAAFARQLGISPQTFNALLKGDIKVPTADVRRKLAREFNLRHVDILVMVGELARDEIEADPRPFSFDSEHAAVSALIPQLDETDARILRKTATAMIEEQDAKQVAAVVESLLAT